MTLCAGTYGRSRVTVKRTPKDPGEPGSWLVAGLLYTRKGIDVLQQRTIPNPTFLARRPLRRCHASGHCPGPLIASARWFPFFTARRYVAPGLEGYSVITMSRLIGRDRCILASEGLAVYPKCAIRRRGAHRSGGATGIP